MNNIELGGHTKMLMTAYRTNSLEDEITGYTLGMLPGRFLIDVSYNTGITFSRSGDTDARNDYMFNVSYMESYYEGSIWDDLQRQSLMKMRRARYAAVLRRAIRS